MKELITFIKRFAAPYKWNIVVSVFFNLLTAFFTLFSFAFIIPILQMLFGINTKQYFFMEVGEASFKDVVIHNFYYYVGEMIAKEGPSLTLLFLGMLRGPSRHLPQQAPLSAWRGIGTFLEYFYRVYGPHSGFFINFALNERIDNLYKAICSSI